jgi:hypothetical protein
MINYLQKFMILAMSIFLSSFIFPSYFTSPYHSIVYAAVISCSSSPGSPNRCYGTEGDDDMKGDAGPNTIGSLGGNDQVTGGPGNDFLHGGDGNDQLTGGPGDDTLYGAFGVDSFKCGAGSDTIWYFDQSEDTKSNDCETLWSGNTTGISNETFTGLPANHTLSANNFSSQ